MKQRYGNIVAERCDILRKQTEDVTDIIPAAETCILPIMTRKFFGRHNELMQQDGIYRRFVNARETAAGWKL